MQYIANGYTPFDVETGEEDPEKDDVYECDDCGAPFTIVDVSDGKVQFTPVVFDEEEWRE